MLVVILLFNFLEIAIVAKPKKYIWKDIVLQNHLTVWSTVLKYIAI